MDDFDWGGLFGEVAKAAIPLIAGNQNKKTAQQAYGQQQQGASQAVSALNPYTELGQRAAALLGNEDITQLPGYQTALDAGLGAINRNAAARGGFNSGNKLKALTKYATDYNASKTAERQNQLMQLINAGQGAATNQAGIYTGLGNAGGASRIAQGNATSSALEGALGLASKYLTSKSGDGKTSNGQQLWNAASGMFGNSAYAPTTQADSFSWSGNAPTASWNDWGFDS